MGTLRAMSWEIPPERQAAVTAFGCVSPLGVGAEATCAGLRAGRDCAEEVTLFDVSGNRCRRAAVVPEECFGDKKAGRAEQLVALALREAVKGDPDFFPELMVIGTTSGGMGYGENFLRAFVRHEKATPRQMRRWVRGYVPQQPVKGAMEGVFPDVPVWIVSNACASGANALGQAMQLIRAGRRKRVLCGGYDALCELVFDGFDCLKASTEEVCRPFDAQRSGLVLGEGAAVFFLESLADCLARGQRPLAILSGYGCTTDTHHLTQPNPDGSGPRRALEEALRSARLKPEDIGYVNAHGTGTPFNDASEGAALEAVFGPKGVPVSSTKGMVGHSLGAAGAIEAAYCLHVLAEGFLPENSNCVEPDPKMQLDLVLGGPREARVRHVASNSFGFGGANASVIFSEMEA